MKRKNEKKEKPQFKGRQKNCKDNKIPESFELKSTQNYTVKQLTKWWLLPGQNSEWILKAIRLGKLPASKIGRRHIVYGADAIRFQKTLRVYKNKQHINT